MLYFIGIFCTLFHGLVASESKKEPRAMFVKHFDEGEKWIETPVKEPSNKTHLTELLHPQKDQLPIGYSFAHFMLPAGSRTVRFRLLKASDAMYILEGNAKVEVDGKVVLLKEKQLLFIPAGASRCIINTGSKNLQYLSIAEPQFKPEEAEILEEVQFEKGK
jgi:mannose-6-phosphate isomerase-like protein (cupin superfamily)